MRSVAFAKVCVSGSFCLGAVQKAVRAGVRVYRLKKTQEGVRFYLKDSDVATFQRVVTTDLFSTYSYQITRPEPLIERCKKRIGFLVGATLFFIGTIFADGYVFSVQVKGAEGIEPSVYAVLLEEGITGVKRYKAVDRERLKAKIFAVDGVAFCSVKKTGATLIVEVVRSSFSEVETESGDMLAKHDGVLQSLTVLAGTPLKKAGDTVQKGDVLVKAEIRAENAEIEPIKTRAIARAHIIKTYRKVWNTQNAFLAQTQAKLDALGCAFDDEKIVEMQTQKTQDGYEVFLRYAVVQTINC